MRMVQAVNFSEGSLQPGVGLEGRSRFRAGQCDLKRCSQKVREVAAVTSAHRQLCTIPHDDDIFSVKPWLQLFDLFDIHKCGSVNADERRRIKFFLNGTHRFTQQVSLGSDMEPNVIARRLDPVDLVILQEEYASPRLYHKSFDLFLRTLQLTQQRIPLLV